MSIEESPTAACDSSADNAQSIGSGMQSASRMTMANETGTGAIICCQCREKPWKYRCPACGVQTCCLRCVKDHKEDTGCTGKRNRTEFVPLKEFTDNHLLSDYHFLEESLKESDAAKKLRAEVGVSVQYRIPQPLEALRKQASNRGTTLLYLAKGMTRRNENTSLYDRRRRCIFWRVEWQFPGADLMLVTARMNENETFGSVLQKHLDAEQAKGRRTIIPYVEAGPNQLRLFFKKQPCRANAVKYIELKASAALKSQLRGRVVIEFPVIHVALPSEAAAFPLCEKEAPLEPERERCAEMRAVEGTEGGPLGDGKWFREEEILEESETPKEGV